MAGGPDLKELALQIMRGVLCRGVSMQSASHYADAIRHTEPEDFIDLLMLGIYTNGYDGGTHGEFEIKFEELGGQRAAKVGIWDDTWEVLPLFKDVLEALPALGTESSADSIEPQTLREHLLFKMGFVDVTRYSAQSLPHEPDYETMRFRADQPKKIPDYFAHLFGEEKDYPYVVCFMGGATFDEGVVSNRPDVEEWVRANAKGKVLVHPNDIFFESEDDALLVSMKYA